MAHPLIAEFCRQAGELRPEFYRRCQRVFQHEVQPMLDERDRLIEENAALLEQIASLKAQLAKTPKGRTADRARVSVGPA